MKRAPLPTQPPTDPTPNPAWLDPSIALDQLSRQAQSANRDHIFAAARMAPGTQRTKLAQSLATLGAELEGTSGEYARVRVPANPDTLKEINDLPEILGLGAMPGELKVAPEFATQALNHPSSELVPVFITLMADDPTGELRQPLASLGVTAGDYDPDVRSYTANMPYGALPALAEADFVMAIEPIAVVQATHDTAVSVMGADALREYQHATGRFTGVTGQGISIGVVDTGLNSNHIDIKSGRASICGANFRYYEGWDLWADLHGHGTHVTGTIAGTGQGDPLFAGMAPNVSDIRFAKTMAYYGRGSSDDVRRGMSFLSRATGCMWNGQATASVKPLIVNMSLAASGLTYSGRGVGERKLDSIVYASDQLYVVAQSNEADQGFSNYGTAKNSLAVGAVDDAGFIAPFSSHGPTADNRLAPNLVGTGVRLSSPIGSAQPSGYITSSGTSMASPSVAGVAALLMEAEAGFQNHPALTRARLMASAIRPDAFLESPAHFPRNNTNGPGIIQNQYGMGLASTRASVLSRDTEHGWVLGSATSEPTDGTYEYVDITVPEGTSRLDIVLTWDEQPADTLTKSVLNNLDLWVDEGADCTQEPCGEYASLSSQDSVEWLFIDEPTPGTHRIKVAPKRLFGETVNAAIAWTIIRGDATPKLDIHVKNAPINPTPGERFEVDLVVRANQYIASGVTLHSDCAHRPNAICRSASHRSGEAQVVREDGISRDLGRIDLTQTIALGELAAGEERRVRLLFEPPSKSGRLYLTASAWNARSGAIAVDIVPSGEGAPPNHAIFPANDDFANATAIQGNSGSATGDFLGASREPGEPHINAESRTLWYSWTAPSEGQFRFRLAIAGDRSHFTSNMHLYAGDTLVSLVSTAETQGSQLSFSAEQGVVYNLQIETKLGNTPPVTLQWERADIRPANDDFFYAQEIPSAAGSVSGSNEGATTERYENWGKPAATVWFKWTAPSDGYWVFSENASGNYVMAFTGDSLQNLRLVSDPYVAYPASFPAKSGETYYIAVAAWSAERSGTQFQLYWSTRERASRPRELAINDQFENALVLVGAEGTARADWTDDRSVQPGEPAETGLGTMWWKWTAPETGRYTWHLGETRILLYSVFTGETLDDLTLVARGSIDPYASFDAVAQTTYWIALGQSQDSFGQYVRFVLPMEWAKAPANDDRDSAAQLLGANGSASADLRFATAELDEPADTVGYESLWWTWNAPASGWHRFWVEDNPLSAIISIYPADGVGGVLSAPVATSERSFVASGRVDAHVLAVAGTRYAIRVARRPNGEPDGPHRLRWESPSTAPAILAYSGAATNATVQSTEFPAPLSGFGNIAFSPDGTRLFATSERRLLMFLRDPADGSLSILDRYDRDADSPSGTVGYDLSSARLRWDEAFGHLIAHGSSQSYAFRLSSDRNSLSYVGTITINGNTGPRSNFSWRSLATDAPGTSLIAVNPVLSEMRVLRADSSRRLTLLQVVKAQGASGEDELLVPAMRSPQDVTFSSDGSHVYLVAQDALLAFSVDDATGKLALSSETLRSHLSDSNPFKGMNALSSVELDESGKYLFVASSSAPSVAVFDVSTDAADPRFLDAALKFYKLDFQRDLAAYHARSHLRPPERMGGCASALRHDRLPAVDYMCSQGYYVARWDAASEALLVTDWGQSNLLDRFGSVIPVVPSSSPSRFAQSPDGKHLYAFGSRPHPEQGDAIHIFQRASAMAAEAE